MWGGGKGDPSKFMHTVLFIVVQYVVHAELHNNMFRSFVLRSLVPHGAEEGALL